jgi:hypothetical protein
MDKNIRIFHSSYVIHGYTHYNKEKLTGKSGNCTFACRRVDDRWLDVAVSFCHTNDTFRKKDGVRSALEHLSLGNYITIPVGRNVNGRELNDVIREFLSRYDTIDGNDFRHVCFGTIPNLPIRDWTYLRFSPRNSYLRNSLSLV